MTGSLTKNGILVARRGQWLWGFEKTVAAIASKLLG